jgi:hypothetical protein
MKCKDFQIHLDDLLDNRLPSSQAEEMNQHARTCPVCSGLWEQRQQLFDLLEESSTLPWSIDIVSSVMREVSGKPIPRESSPFRIPIAIAVITGIAVFVLALFFGLSSVLTGISPFELGKALISMFNLPPAVHRSIEEITALIRGLWVGISALVSIVFRLIFRIIKNNPVLVLPIVIIISSFAGWVWMLRKSRKRYSHS